MAQDANKPVPVVRVSFSGFVDFPINGKISEAVAMFQTAVRSSVANDYVKADARRQGRKAPLPGSHEGYYPATEVEVLNIPAEIAKRLKADKLFIDAPAGSKIVTVGQKGTSEVTVTDDLATLIASYSQPETPQA